MDDIDLVKQALLTFDPDGRRFAKAIRKTYDLLLDGQHTGRYRWEQLHKTEKTHCGTLVEINLQREFQFADGKILDYEIAGAEVDCKYSQSYGHWMIPPEAVGHILLAVWGSDQEGMFRAGLIRATEELLRGKGNRDGKRTLNRASFQQHMVPLYHAALPDNVLLRLSPEVEESIFKLHTGTKRVDELFRRVQRRPISRVAVATVAQQEDYMKRVRYDGGSRSHLRAEGIVILGQYGAHGQIARDLNLPEPSRGDFISVRLSPRTLDRFTEPFTSIDGSDWVIAREDDPPVVAPKLPDVRRSPTDTADE